jgi:hypothetical protein
VTPSPAGDEGQRAVDREQRVRAQHLAQHPGAQDQVVAAERGAGLAAEAVIAARVDVPAVARIRVDAVPVGLAGDDVGGEGVVEAEFARGEPVTGVVAARDPGVEADPGQAPGSLRMAPWSLPP